MCVSESVGIIEITSDGRNRAARAGIEWLGELDSVLIDALVNKSRIAGYQRF